MKEGGNGTQMSQLIVAVALLSFGKVMVEMVIIINKFMQENMKKLGFPRLVPL